MARKILAMILAMLMIMSCTAVMAEETEGEWWNILLIGCDDRNVKNHKGRTDTIMILSINEAEGDAKLTSIMRDTWVSIEGHGKNKINAANVFGGPELAVATVNKNFGTDIEKYILLNMGDLANIIDMFGGVDIELIDNEVRVANDYIDNYKKYFSNKNKNLDYTHISSSGLVHLNGLQAMSHCRDRYTDSDFGRVMRGQDTLLALAAKAQNMDLNEVLDIAANISEFVVTNLTAEEVKNVAQTVLTSDPETVGQYRLPADGAFKSGTFSGTWMIKADLEKNARILHDYIYGE